MDIRIIKVSELLDTKFSDWDCQRFITEERVQELQKSIQENMMVFGCIIIYKNISNNEDIRIIIDGQHRYRALERIREHVKDLNVVIQEIETKLDPFHIFKMVNNTCPLNIKDETEFSMEKGNQITKIFRSKYSKYFSTSVAPQKPNVNENIFANIVREIIKITKLGDIQSICDILHKYNNEIEKNIENLNVTNKMKEKANKERFFIGLIRGVDKDILKYIVEDIIEDDIDNLENEDSKRVKFSKDDRLTVWEKYYRSTRGPCLGCDTEITIITMEMSHIIPLKHGGSNKLTNIIPLCRRCNLNCGTKNANDFIKENRNK